MRATLQNLCEQFIRNRDTLQSAFKWHSAYMAAVCAHLFAAAGKTADAAALQACRNLIKNRSKWYSSFRGNVHMPLACLISMEQDPVAAFTRAEDTYRLFRAHFPASDHLALAAALLCNASYTTQDAARARALWDLIRKEHPFLTGPEDTLLCLLLCRSKRDDESIIRHMESCYLHLKSRFGYANWTQSVSHILTLSDAAPEHQVRRLFDLYDSISLAGGKYGKSYELPALAAFASVDADARAVAMDVMDADLFLSEQTGYGFFGLGKQTRLMHAIMIVSGEYARQEGMDMALLGSTLSLIIAQQQAAY